MLTALFQNLREAQASPRVRAIVLTGAGNNFSAGFDINLFATGGVLDDRVSGAFSELLEAGPKPSVAAVQVGTTFYTIISKGYKYKHRPSDFGNTH